MKIAYNLCQIDNHDESFLNQVCIDESCTQQQKLLCCFCTEDHTCHRMTSLRKFLLEYQQQYQKHKGEEEEFQNQYSLIQTLSLLESEVRRAKQIINVHFDSLLDSLLEYKFITICSSKKKWQQMVDPTCDTIGKILSLIKTSENMLEDFAILTSQINNLQPSDGNSYTINKPKEKISNQKERYFLSEKVLNNYKEFNQQYLPELQNRSESLQFYIKNLFDNQNTFNTQKEKSSCQVQSATPIQNAQEKKVIEETKEQQIPQSSINSQKEIEKKEFSFANAFVDHNEDANLFQLLQNPVAQKQPEVKSPRKPKAKSSEIVISQIERKQKSLYEKTNYNGQELQIVNIDEVVENKQQNIKVIFGDFAKVTPSIQKVLFLDKDNIFILSNDGKGTHYNLPQKKILGQQNSDLGDSVTDATYSDLTKQMFFGTKNGYLHSFNYNIENQEDRPLICVGKIKPEKSSLLFISASSDETLIYTLSEEKNLKAINSSSQKEAARFETFPEKPNSLMIYKDRILVGAEAGFGSYDIISKRCVYTNMRSEIQNEKVISAYLYGNVIYVICNKSIRVKNAQNFQTRNTISYQNQIRAQQFLAQFNIFIICFQKSYSQTKTNETIMQNMESGYQGKKEKIDEEDWSYVFVCQYQNSPTVIVAKPSGYFRQLNFKKMI